jgi:hypothetical protein
MPVRPGKTSFGLKEQRNLVGKRWSYVEGVERTKYCSNRGSNGRHQCMNGGITQYEMLNNLARWIETGGDWSVVVRMIAQMVHSEDLTFLDWGNLNVTSRKHRTNKQQTNMPNLVVNGKDTGGNQGYWGRWTYG